MLMRERRDFPVTIYRILLYLSRMRESSPNKRRLVKIQRAVDIDRKEIKPMLEKMEAVGLVEKHDTGRVGQGGHAIVHWKITESGKMWRKDIGQFIQLAQRMAVYPEEFFYLPSDNM